jgi:DNA repair exonuclease SbcCD ATPase subunit
MKILGLQVENYKRLKAVEITPDGNSVIISGKNGQGKSSLLEAIWVALGGKKYLPEKPIREGEERAVLRLDLGDLVATRIITPKGDRLEVANKEGAVFRSPQAILDSLIGKLSFDPLEFARGNSAQDKRRRLETLSEIVELDFDKETFMEELGVEGELPDDPAQAINAAYKMIYDERTGINRDMDRAKKSLEALGEIEKAEPVSITELIAEKERLEAENEENDRLREELEWQEERIAEIDKDIEIIEVQIEELLKRRTEFENERKKVGNELERLKEDVAQLQDNDLTEINQKIASADEINRKAQRWQDYLKTKKQVEEYEAESQKLTDKLKWIKRYKQDMIARAKFPVKGLDFTEDGVLYNGLPFEQAGEAEKLRVSFAIAAAMNPKLRVVTIDGAECLDPEHLGLVQKMAEERDMQVWMTVVDDSGKVGIVIEDGEVKNAVGGGNE